MTFTSPFTLPPKPEPRDPYEDYEGLWAASWASTMQRYPTHIVSRRGDPVALCKRRIPYHVRPNYRPINAAMVYITCQACECKAATTGRTG